LIASSFVLGCQAAPQDFIPLEMGRTAVYDVEYVTGLGDVQRAQAIVRIDAKKQIGGHEYVRVVQVVTGIPGYEPQILYQRMAADGLHEVRYVEGRPVEYLSLPLPLTVGRQWTFEVAGSRIACRVEAQEPAVLPEKTYNDAYKIACSGTQTGVYSSSRAYMVQGLGEVKLIQEVGTTKMEMRLREVED
jgi:hypothetical protein